MPKGYVIDAEGIQKLREDHEILRKMILQMQQKITGTVGAGIRANSEFVKVTTMITQRDTSSSALEKTLGRGIVELYKIVKESDDVVTFEKVTDSEGNATEMLVYNANRVPVTEDSYIRITRNFRSGLWMVGEIQTAVAKTHGNPPSARIGTTLGTGTVSIYSNSSGVLSDTGENITVSNLSATAVAANTYITIKKYSLSEDWIVDAEDCG
tara:strand:- start:1157 stop:1789 length:633 start_codon:yes stop_codon:yes gene_type:complete